MNVETVPFRYMGASAKLEILGDGLAFLRNVYSTTRGQGHGSGVMQLVCDYADTYDITIISSPVPYGHPNFKPLDLLSLCAFYEKFDFIIKQSKRRGFFPTMMRQPNEK